MIIGQCRKRIRLDEKSTYRPITRVGVVAAARAPTAAARATLPRQGNIPQRKSSCQPKCQLGVVAKSPLPCCNAVTISSVMVYILGHTSSLRVDRDDFVYLVKVALPRSTSSQDFNDIVAQILKDKLPLYSGGFECRCSKMDMDRSSVRIAKLATEEKVNPSDIPPGLLLPLLGRVFVVLSDPSDLPLQSKHVSPLTTNLERHLRNSVSLDFPQNTSYAEEAWCPIEAFDGDDFDRVLSPIRDCANRKRKRPISPYLDAVVREVSDYNRTIKVMKEIEAEIQSLAEISQEFHFRGHGASGSNCSKSDK